MAHCYRAKIFEAVDCPFDDIASAICLRVETCWGAALATFVQTAFLGVESFGADTADATLLELLPVTARAVGTVNAYRSRALPRSSRPRMRNVNGIQYCTDLCGIATLTCCDHNGKRQTVTINTQVNFAGNSASGSP